eukprot:PhM_4_TR8909/c0_g1_i1/m.96856
MSKKFVRNTKRVSADEVARIKETFGAFDSNKDGVLSKDEFKGVLVRMDIKLTPEDVDLFFKEVDTDGSGEIELSEFVDCYNSLLDLAEEEVQKSIRMLETTTSFSRSEIEAMYEHFKNVSSSIVSDGAIDRDEFRQMMIQGNVASWNTFLLDGLFRMFDTDSNGAITFSEFVANLSIYHNKGGTKTAEKHKMLFGIYDVDKDGKISKTDLANVLQDCLNCNGMALGDAEIMKIVEATLKRNGKQKDDALDFDAYMHEVKERKLE